MLKEKKRFASDGNWKHCKNGKEKAQFSCVFRSKITQHESGKRENSSFMFIHTIFLINMINVFRRLWPESEKKNINVNNKYLC